MTINYTTEPIKPKQTYPWVGRLDTEGQHTTVLFIAPEQGFCLDSTDKCNIEHRYYDEWDEPKFIPCSITLSSL